MPAAAATLCRPVRDRSGGAPRSARGRAAPGLLSPIVQSRPNSSPRARPSLQAQRTLRIKRKSRATTPRRRAPRQPGLRSAHSGRYGLSRPRGPPSYFLQSVDRAQSLQPHPHDSIRVVDLEDAIDSAGHDEIVFMQPLDLLRAQGNRRIAPAETDIRMVALCFRELADALHEAQRLAKVTKPEAPLDAVRVIAKLPVRHLNMEPLGVFLSQGRDAAAAGRARLLRKVIHHRVISASCPPIDLAEYDVEGTFLQACVFRAAQG